MKTTMRVLRERYVLLGRGHSFFGHCDTAQRIWYRCPLETFPNYQQYLYCIFLLEARTAWSCSELRAN